MTELLRQEIRRFIFPNQLTILESFLNNSNYEKVTFSNKPITQTIYFNHDEFFLPFNLSYKVRSYLPEPKEPVIQDNEEYILEKKSFVFKNKIPHKTKERTEMFGKEIKEFFLKNSLSHILDDFLITNEFNNKEFSFIFLQPHIATQYQRNHYIKGENLRITIDKNLRTYYYEKGKPIEVSNFDIIPVEIKVNGEEKDVEELIDFLNSINAPTSISKKNYCYNDMAHKRFSKISDEYRTDNEIPNNELEAKYNIKNIPESLAFLQLRKYFNEEEDYFTINEIHPYTEEIASIHRYYQVGNTFPRVAFTGNIGTVSVKGKNNSSSSFTQRKEKKQKTKKFTSLQEIVPSDSNFVGELTRIRRAFWIISPENRLYKIAVDNSYTKSHHLGQIEIEYLGIRPGGNPNNFQETITKDIKRLQSTIEHCLGKNVELTTLSKLEWLQEKIE